MHTVMNYTYCTKLQIDLWIRNWNYFKFICCQSTWLECEISSGSMVQPQMDWDQFRNVSNLVLVEPNRIRDSIYACIRLLYANFLTLKLLHTCTCHLTM